MIRNQPTRCSKARGWYFARVLTAAAIATRTATAREQPHDWPAVEVEPNVVLCTYWNWTQREPMLAQLVRLHPDRVEPLPR